MNKEKFLKPEMIESLILFHRLVLVSAGNIKNRDGGLIAEPGLSSYSSGTNWTLTDLLLTALEKNIFP